MAIVLFTDKENCCGCGACENICPKNAIQMEPDQTGFLYPVINNELCIECGACKKVCNYQNKHELHEPRRIFAAVNQDEKQRMCSASGGVFSAIASKILKEGGVVFGAALSFDNGYANPHHIGIESMEELPKLQGSKYVQSKIGDTYKRAKKYLAEGRTVLFSGTPCQIDGLYGFLKRDYDHLITIDVICHGVPNERIFNAYLQEEKKKRKADLITGYVFRDKRKGWGMYGRIDSIQKNGLTKSECVPARVTSYNTFFLDGDIYRKNCYTCKYAKRSRPSDLTIGDYWGIEAEHPELVKKYGAQNGISCVLVNSEKGISLCEGLKDKIEFHDSTFEKVSYRNRQLVESSQQSNNRELIMNLYMAKGYESVEEWFKEKYKYKIMMHAVYNLLPFEWKQRVKKLKK